MSTAIGSELGEYIARTIEEKTQGAVRELRVEVEPERVLLFGRSPAFYHKQMASHVAMSLTRDRLVCNSIEVL